MLKVVVPYHCFIIPGAKKSLRTVPKYLAVVAAVELKPESGVPFCPRVNCSLCPGAPVVLYVNYVHARNKPGKATLFE